MDVGTSSNADLGGSARFSTEDGGAFYDARTERPSYPSSLASTQELDIRSPSGQQQQVVQHQPSFGPSGLPPRHSSGAGNVTPHVGGQLPERPPVVMRLASTRAPFSPHALKGGAADGINGPGPARETMSSKSVPPPPPLLASLEELLSPPSLQPYLPFMQNRLQSMASSGFVSPPSSTASQLPTASGAPMSPLLSLLLDALDDHQTEALLDEVEAEAEVHAIYLRPAHRDQISKRIREERMKRGTCCDRAVAHGRCCV